MPRAIDAATLTFAYNPSDFAVSVDGGNTFTPIAIGGTAEAPTVSLIAGEILEIGVTGEVTNNPNPAVSLPYSVGTNVQPATLGLAAFGFGFNTANGSVASMDPTNTVVAENFTTIADYGAQDGAGGVIPDSINGGNLGEAINSRTTSGRAQLSYAAGTSAELFNGLYIDATATGVAAFNPTSSLGDFAYLKYASGGTSATNRPSYLNTAATSGVDVLNALPVLTVIVNGGTPPPPLSYAIFGFGTTSPAPHFGTQLNGSSGTATFDPRDEFNDSMDLSLIQSPDIYNAAYAHVVSPGGASDNYINVTGFDGKTGQEVFGVHLLVDGEDPTTGQLAQIIQDINSIPNSGVFAEPVPADFSSQFGSLYNLALITTALPAYGGTSYLEFDFSAETNVGGVTATDFVVSVPEPATVGVVLSATALLLGRRRR